MDQNKVALCWPNRIDQSALTGGNWTTTLPLTNLLTRELAQKARTTGTLGDTFGPGLNSQFQIGLDSARPIGVLSLAAHNMSSVAKVRVRFYTDYAMTNMVWDSGTLDAWPAGYAADILEWEDNNFWFGNNSVDPLSDYTAQFTVFANQIYNVRQITVEILDSTNQTGYVEIGRAFVSTVWQPTINMDYAPQHGHVNTTAVEEALDNTEYFDRRKQRRMVQFSLGALSVSEAFGTLYGMQRDMGVDKEILYAYNLTRDDAFYVRTFIGRYKEVSPLTQPYLDRHTNPIHIQEIL